MFKNVPKVIFAVLCYICTLVLAFLSGYFTVVFYAESQTGWNMLVLGSLAGMLEFIKIMLAVSFPFIKHRDVKLEKKVAFYLKICFFLSIMASLNFFMSGGDIERSPASTITGLLYEYMPILGIIPLKFSQFMTTISLSVLVEAMIVFLPTIAPIMFLKKSYSTEKEIAVTNIEKLKEIIRVIPDRFIDNIYKKVVENESNFYIKEIEEPKVKLKLIKPSKLLIAKDSEKKNDTLDNCKDNKLETSVNYRDLEELISVIFENQRENKCPSITYLTDETRFTRTQITDMKKYLTELNILETKGTITKIEKSKEESLKIIEGVKNNHECI